MIHHALQACSAGSANDLAGVKPGFWHYFEVLSCAGKSDRDMASCPCYHAPTPHPPASISHAALALQSHDIISSCLIHRHTSCSSCVASCVPEPQCFGCGTFFSRSHIETMNPPPRITPAYPDAPTSSAQPAYSSPQSLQQERPHPISHKPIPAPISPHPTTRLNSPPTNPFPFPTPPYTPQI